VFFVFTVSAKDKVIVNPAYEFTNTGVTHITQIELGKEETRVHIHSTFIPHWWVKFTSKTYLEDCATGQKLYITGMTNGELNKEIFMPDSGDSTFVLIFPKLDKSVVKINYGEEDENDKSYIYGISLDSKTKQRSKTIPTKVQAWIDNELAQAKRKTPMNFSAGEFFSRDTARIVGYINGYDTRAGFSTGIIYIGNEITREDYPIAITIREDGQFEGNIPMNYPKNVTISFQHSRIPVYIQPGQTLSLILDWNEFLMADRFRNIRYKISNINFQGATADINKELTAFCAQLPELPYQKIYDESKKKEYVEYKAFLETVTAGFTNQFKRLLDTEKLSEETRKILLDNYKIEFVTFLLDYEMEYKYNNRDKKLPVEFYSFLQDIPMNDKELLSTSNFSTFINRFEYSSPFFNAENKAYQSASPQKTFYEYLFEELGIKKMPDDELFIALQDSFSFKLYQPDMTEEDRQKMRDNYQKSWTAFLGKHGEDKWEAYQKKYVEVLPKQSRRGMETEKWRIRDSVFINVLKLTPGIVNDIVKVRSLDNALGDWLKFEIEECRVFLTHIENGIKETFLREEVERLYRKNYPLEKRIAYELPNTQAAKIFKDLITPHKGKILLVDFWATWCGPCTSNIKNQKGLREKHKDSKDVDFVFITDETSPLVAYNKFVEEQQLTNTYRLNEDDYRYLRQLFRFNGIPKYIMVDREGKILNDNTHSHTFETELKEILELEKQ
jgi:thiol-disulfide isomerase/thioredoxin